MNTKCLLCNSNDVESYYNKNNLYTIRCLSCGVVYVYPQPSLEEIKAIYENDEYFSSHYYKINKLKNTKNEIKEEILMKLSAVVRIADIHQKIGKGVAEVKFLEIGSSYGNVLEIANLYGWQVYGIEINKKLAEYTKKKGLNVIGGNFEDILPNLPKNFDIVVLYHVIEHIPNPIALIESIYNILTPGGLFILQTPNVQSGNFINQKTDWEYFKPPEHLFYFSFKSLQIILEKMGFIIIGQEKSNMFIMLKQIIHAPFIRIFKSIGLSLNMNNNIIIIGSIIKKFIKKSANSDDTFTIFAKKL